MMPDEMPEGLDAIDERSENLGRRVREVWVQWAEQQPEPKPSWLVPWEELDEPSKEIDRRIGLAIWGDCFAEWQDVLAERNALRFQEPALRAEVERLKQRQEPGTLARMGEALHDIAEEMGKSPVSSDCPAAFIRSGIERLKQTARMEVSTIGPLDEAIAGLKERESITIFSEDEAIKVVAEKDGEDIRGELIDALTDENERLKAKLGRAEPLRWEIVVNGGVEARVRREGNADAIHARWKLQWQDVIIRDRLADLSEVDDERE